MARRNKDAKPQKCSVCGNTQLATIIYGEPAWSPEMEELLKNGEIAIGGCCVVSCMPEWQCTRCGEYFGEVRFD